MKKVKSETLTRRLTFDDFGMALLKNWKEWVTSKGFEVTKEELPEAWKALTPEGAKISITVRINPTMDTIIFIVIKFDPNIKVSRNELRERFHTAMKDFKKVFKKQVNN